MLNSTHLLCLGSNSYSFSVIFSSTIFCNLETYISIYYVMYAHSIMLYIFKCAYVTVLMTVLYHKYHYKSYFSGHQGSSVH